MYHTDTQVFQRLHSYSRPAEGETSMGKDRQGAGDREGAVRGPGACDSKGGVGIGDRDGARGMWLID